MSLLKLLSMRARNKLRTRKLPMMRAGMKINMQVAGYPCYNSADIREQAEQRHFPTEFD